MVLEAIKSFIEPEPERTPADSVVTSVKDFPQTPWGLKPLLIYFRRKIPHQEKLLRERYLDKASTIAKLYYGESRALLLVANFHNPAGISIYAREEKKHFATKETLDLLIKHISSSLEQQIGFFLEVPLQLGDIRRHAVESLGSFFLRPELLVWKPTSDHSDPYSGDYKSKHLGASLTTVVCERDQLLIVNVGSNFIGRVEKPGEIRIIGQASPASAWKPLRVMEMAIPWSKENKRTIVIGTDGITSDKRKFKMIQPEGKSLLLEEKWDGLMLVI